MYYILSIADYERYSPYWFDCNCSKKEFLKKVTDAVDSATREIIKLKLVDYKITPDDIIEKAISLLEKEKGIIHIKKDYEISMVDIFLGRKDEDSEKPIFMSPEVWKELNAYNIEVDNRLYAND